MFLSSGFACRQHRATEKFRGGLRRLRGVSPADGTERAMKSGRECCLHPCCRNFRGGGKKPGIREKMRDPGFRGVVFIGVCSSDDDAGQKSWRCRTSICRVQGFAFQTIRPVVLRKKRVFPFSFGRATLSAASRVTFFNDDALLFLKSRSSTRLSGKGRTVVGHRGWARERTPTLSARRNDAGPAGHAWQKRPDADIPHLRFRSPETEADSAFPPGRQRLSSLLRLPEAAGAAKPRGGTGGRGGGNHSPRMPFLSFLPFTRRGGGCRWRGFRRFRYRRSGFFSGGRRVRPGGP